MAPGKGQITRERGRAQVEEDAFQLPQLDKELLRQVKHRKVACLAWVRNAAPMPQEVVGVPEAHLLLGSAVAFRKRPATNFIR